MACRLYPLLICLVFACTQVIHPMRKEDQDSEDTPLSQHLKNFSLKKTSKTRTQEQHDNEPLTELEQHRRNFNEGRTRPTLEDLIKPLPLNEPNDLQKHILDFYRVPSRPVQYIEREKPFKQKTELEKKVEARALRLAVWDNKVNLVHELLDQCDDPNAVSPNNLKSTLHVAATRGHTQLVDVLLNNPRIDRELIDANKHTPMCYSLFEAHVSCLRLFIEHRSWLGPDTNNHNCLHGAIFTDKIESLVTLLTYPLDPLRPIEITNTHVWLEENVELQPYHTLQERSIIELYNYIKSGVQGSRCDLLSKVFGGPFNFKLSSAQCEELTRHMPFHIARKLVRLFPMEEQELVATALAPHYASRHLFNIDALIHTTSHNNQTPFELAQALDRLPLMQSLVDPDLYLVNIHRLLRKLPLLKKRLAKNPDAQDPLEMFIQLFIYRLLDRPEKYKPLKQHSEQ